MATFDRSVSRTTGPLAHYAAVFTAEMAAQGYSESSIYLHLQLVAELSAWLSSQGLGVEQLSPTVADRFVPTMRATRRRLKSPRGLAPVLRYLRGLGALPAPGSMPDSEPDALLAAYQQFGELFIVGYGCDPDRRRPTGRSRLGCPAASATFRS